VERETLRGMLAEGRSLADIGAVVGLHESTVGYWAKKHGLEPIGKAKHAAKGPIARETLEALVAEGASIAQIAEAVERSKATVRHWLREYRLKTTWAERIEASGEKHLELSLECPHHGVTTFRLRGSGGYRCLKCRAEAVTARRRKVKETLVEEAGGRCQACGYDRCLSALQFHHLASGEERFGLSERGVTRSLERARAEASKCVLLCGNCHAEVEAGVRTVP